MKKIKYEELYYLVVVLTAYRLQQIQRFFSSSPHFDQL
jgi:hypothetical protein